MAQNQKFSDLICRNEDWLLSRILSYAKNSKDKYFSPLINHTWRNSISNFTKFLNSQKECASNPELPYNPNPNKNIELTEFVTSEAQKCLRKNINNHTYLTYLKLFRNAYIEMINNANLENKDKKDFSRYVENCFDSLEIAFIEHYSIKNEEIKLTKNLQKKSSVDFHKNILNSIPFPVIILDANNKFIELNNSVAIEFPFIEEHNISNLKLLAAYTGFKELNSKINEFRISQHQESQIELVIRTKQQNHWHIIKLRKIKNTDNVLINFIDINNKFIEISKLSKERDNEKESNKLKTTFLANMSHEIRTPMNAIVGFSELISMSNPSEEEKAEYLSLIRNSSNDLLNIIEDIIDIAKIEARQLKINTKNTNLFEVFSEITKIYKEVLVKHGKENIKLNLCIPENEKNLIVRTDPKRLKQVVSNLVGNAIKFTNEGAIDIGYKLAANKIIYFFVKDSGIGIPYNRQKTIFDRFVQVDDAYSKNSTGTGLGLTISRNIINILGGNIWASSQPGKGSNFYFYLPNIPATEEMKPTSNVEPKTLSNINLTDKHILIAEDEDVNFHYLQELFKYTGVKLHRAKTGSEAISIAENLSLDAIIMDIKMPEINGIEAARYIKHIKPEIPIVALSAFAMEEDRINCLSAGCEDFLSKPVQKENIFYILKKHIFQASNKVLG